MLKQLLLVCLLATTVNSLRWQADSTVDSAGAMAVPISRSSSASCSFSGTLTTPGADWFVQNGDSVEFNNTDLENGSSWCFNATTPMATANYFMRFRPLTEVTTRIVVTFTLNGSPVNLTLPATMPIQQYGLFVTPGILATSLAPLNLLSYFNSSMQIFYEDPTVPYQVLLSAQFSSMNAAVLNSNQGNNIKWFWDIPGGFRGQSFWLPLDSFNRTKSQDVINIDITWWYEPEYLPMNMNFEALLLSTGCANSVEAGRLSRSAGSLGPTSLQLSFQASNLHNDLCPNVFNVLSLAFTPADPNPFSVVLYPSFTTTIQFESNVIIAPPNPPKKGLSTAEIVGISVGAFVAGFLLVGLIAYFVRKHHHSRADYEQF